MTIFAKIGPKPVNVTLIDTTRCTLGDLLSCIIPEDCRIWININSAKKIKILSGPHFVRAVNSSFYEVIILKKRYFISEIHLWDKK